MRRPRSASCARQFPARASRCVAGVVLLALAAGAAANAEERFPPPEFTKYQIPRLSDLLQRTPPRSEALAYLDVGMLVAALALAAYLGLVRRSRRALFLLMLASLGYFGFYRQGCICPIGAIQNLTLALCSPSYALPLVAAAFFFLPLIAALIVGRVFCGAVCPLGAIQDLLLLKPITLPRELTAALSLLPYVYLALGVLFASMGTAFVICEYDPFVAIFRREGTFNMLLFGGSLLLIGVFVGRPYCRFLCPYGVLLRWLAPLAKWRVKVDRKSVV
jgi:NosR/NirI family transcriptional regulator, nitrous oxide reductase regulator